MISLGGYTGKLQCGKYKPTNVISISYAIGEDQVPVNYFRRQCNEYMKLGMQGVSVIVASGDSGVSNGIGPGGINTACLGPNYTIFAPGFPASCPYLTVLGGTYLPTGANPEKDQEQAVKLDSNRAGGFASGGGFSNVFLQPAYQRAAVQNYLDKYPPPFASYETLYNASVYNGSGFGANGGVYNSIGRAYPDFAGVAANVFGILNGEPAYFGGTSAAAPVFASILTRINEELLLAGKPTVGFVNPVLVSSDTSGCRGKQAIWLTWRSVCSPGGVARYHGGE